MRRGRRSVCFTIGEAFFLHASHGLNISVPIAFLCFTRVPRPQRAVFRGDADHNDRSLFVVGDDPERRLSLEGVPQ